MKKAITYYRVSTERQGLSGLGLEAQRKSVQDFAKSNGIMLISEFIEIESGMRNSRPILNQALATCKKDGATLLIAKLDRLGRNVAFISKLIESGVDFKAVDNPFAGKLIVHIMAAFAEHERDQISERTKAALVAAKARGVVLGTYGRDVLSKKNKERADLFAHSLWPVIQQIRTKGFGTLHLLTDELNRLQVPTFRNNGQKWHISTVHTLLQRLKTLNSIPIQ